MRHDYTLVWPSYSKSELQPLVVTLAFNHKGCCRDFPTSMPGFLHECHPGATCSFHTALKPLQLKLFPANQSLLCRICPALNVITSTVLLHLKYVPCIKKYFKWLLLFLVCFGHILWIFTRPLDLAKELVNIGSGNDLVLPGNKPLPEPWIYVVLWCQYATMRYGLFWFSHDWHSGIFTTTMIMLTHPPCDISFWG